VPEFSKDKKVLELVQQAIAENLGCDEGEVTPDAKLTTDLGADSLDVIEMMMTLEEEFGIEMSDDEAEKLADATITDIVAAVEAKLALKKRREV
jgi:acyl carrier protein